MPLLFQSPSITRRCFIAGSATALLGVGHPQGSSAQSSGPEGRIAYARDGHIYMWSSDEGNVQLMEDGNGTDPTWQPGADYMAYIRKGGTYSNVVLANTRTGRSKRLTQNESEHHPGSREYVEQSALAIDPCWGQSGILCYGSDKESEDGRFRLWVMNPRNGEDYLAADDLAEPGPLEHVSVDANGIWAVYTVFAPDPAGGITYVSVRDLNTGTTFPMIEAVGGAFDPAISPDGEWIVASLRGESGMSDLWLCNRQTEDIVKLTEGEQASASTFSPDGQWIAYLARTDGGFEIRAMALDYANMGKVGDATTLVDPRDIDAAGGLSWNTL